MDTHAMKLREDVLLAMTAAWLQLKACSISKL